jgi:hypothetical protein
MRATKGIRAVCVQRSVGTFSLDSAVNLLQRRAKLLLDWGIRFHEEASLIGCGRADSCKRILC